MSIRISRFTKQLSGHVPLSSSKSESNRALIINALAGNTMKLKNLSDARDTQTMQRLLSEAGDVWDVLDAGTTMRFCTAFLGVKGTGQVITGSPRMKERPIGLLVDALRKLGATVDYLEKDGYPPMRITKPTNIHTNHLSIPGNISSQFISALLMIAPALPKGLVLELTGEIFSRPYIEMTLSLMKHFGVQHTWQDKVISIPPQQYTSNEYTIESDWSGASYWYSMVAANKGSKVQLIGLREHSTQGDQEIASIMAGMGVKTSYNENGAILENVNGAKPNMRIDFRTCPDLAQTVMVTAALKHVKLEMTGLESLRIKETDRIAAMQAELKKLNATLKEENNFWTLQPGLVPLDVEPVETYEDHRMAMAFGPVAMAANVTIKDPEVVQKSYPGYWDHMKKLGVQIADV